MSFTATVTWLNPKQHGIEVSDGEPWGPQPAGACGAEVQRTDTPVSIFPDLLPCSTSVQRFLRSKPASKPRK
jgi:hypothetical protein